jgi:hypothetical protein
MEALFRQIGIYSHVGQLYEPVDANTLMYYHEAKDGQLLEEGITEAGSMCSFIAAGTELFRNDELRVWTLDGSVLIASITSKMHLIGPGVIEGLLKAVELAEKIAANFEGLGV